MADLQIAAWREGFAGILSPAVRIPERAEFLLMGQSAAGEPGVERTVAVVDGRIVGFCTHGSSRDQDAPAHVGEVRAMFVHPDRWRSGVGTALVSNAVESLRNAGYREVTLWSFRDNERANAFYERQGFRRDGATQTREPFGGAEEVRYRRDL
jgi:GNAT superfamily N-acetyltransferase